MLNLKQEYQNELNNIFETYCPKAEIWVYGSRIKDNSHSGSDLDLVVKSFNDTNKFVWELQELIGNSDIPFIVDIHEFDKLPQSFQEEIKKEYVKIFPYK